MIPAISVATGLVIVFLAYSFVSRATSLTTVVARARASGDLSTVVELIEASPEAGQATQWDQAIGALWQAYAREDAARLMVEAAQRTDAPVVQFWIRQALEIEPEIAQAHFSAEFMAEYFKPEVALACGKGCGCG